MQHVYDAGEAPGGFPPTSPNDEAPTADTVRGLGDQAQGARSNCGTATDSDKTFSTLQSQAALAGFELARGADEGGRFRYAVSRWGLRHELADLDDVVRWVAKATGRYAA